jgi:hypothetical protein
LRDVAEERLQEVISLMRSDGFYTLLDRDRTLLEGLAALGICCSTLTPYASFAAAFLENKWLSYSRTLEAADRLFSTYGVGRVWRDDEHGASLPSV